MDTFVRRIVVVTEPRNEVSNNGDATVVGAADGANRAVKCDGLLARICLIIRYCSHVREPLEDSHEHNFHLEPDRLDCATHDTPDGPWHIWVT